MAEYSRQRPKNSKSWAEVVLQQGEDLAEVYLERVINQGRLESLEIIMTNKITQLKATPDKKSPVKSKAR